MEKKGIIFDVDGLLVDTEKLHIMAWEEVFKDKKINLSERDYEKGIGIDDREFLEMMKKEGKIPSFYSIGDLCKEKKEKLLRLVEKVEINVFEGVKEVLKYLSGKVQMAVATNSEREYVIKILEKTGIKRFFKFIISRNDVKNPKPAPEIYLLAAEKMGLAPEKCIVFEDSETGIEAAKRAGMFCIGVVTTQSPDKLKKADVVIEKLSLEKIKKFLPI